MKAYAFALSCLAAVAGCSASADSSDTTDTATADLVSVRTLGDLEVTELRSAARERFATSLATLSAAHPEVTKLTRSNIGDFVERKIDMGGFLTNDVDRDFSETFSALLRWTGESELLISELGERFGGWLETQLPAATLASGKIGCDMVAGPLVRRACYVAEETKAIRSAKPARGADLPEFVAAWKGKDRAGARFVGPLALSGDPSTKEVKDLAGVSEGCRQRAWGTEAVDEFLAFHQDLAPFASSLKSQGIAKRWYWACGGDSWGESGFALLDEHNQLWAVTSSSSE